ncbi:ATP-binding protein [Sulfitobacter sp. LCG007]
MTLDIRGSLKNTRKSKNALVVVDELMANSIDAFLIRRSASGGDLSLEINFTTKARKSDLLGQEYDLEVECVDNGCGLGPDQLKAFLTKDTSYKDDLRISGIGNCKGAGRVQFFHHFSKLSLSSMYSKDGKKFSVHLPAEDSRKLIEENDFKIEPRDDGEIGTSVRLSGVLPKVRETIFTVQFVQESFEAAALKQYVLFSALQRFVSLQDVLGDFRIEFESDLDGVKSSATLSASDIPERTSVSNLDIIHVEDDQTIKAPVIVTHYRLDEGRYPLPKNVVGLCARSAIAEDITKRYLRSKSIENNAIRGFYHIILVEGQLLDEGVNEHRDGFDKIRQENGNADLFDGIQISFEDIYAKLDDKVQEILTPPDWSRDKIVSEVGKDFGVSEEMLSHSNTRVTFGDTPSSVAKRALRNLQDKVVDETASLLSMKEAIAQLEPDSDDFRRKVNELSWQFTASLKTVDMANLSQLVVRRSNMIEVLAMAVKELLKVQTDVRPGERKKNEALIHNIFFPMRKDSSEISDHDVWLLSEEYHYYDYIASDKPLSQIRMGDEMLFEEEIDARVDEFLGRMSQENKAVRPDIALFHEEGAVVIVEFKAPGVSLDNHFGDLVEYATLLAAKSRGKLRKFYGYLIGDKVNSARLGSFKPLPGAKGWFDTTDIREPETQVGIGQLYSELLYYDDVVERSRKRIEVYRERLKLPN